MLQSEQAKMKIVDTYPPNIDKIAAALPGARRTGVIFTYGSTIYAPHGVKVSSALKRHEQVHSDRQAIIGVEQWWDRYIDSSEFRFHEELLAHRAEYDWFRTYRPGKCRAMLHTITARLSSDLYGSVVLRKQCEDLILRKENSADYDWFRTTYVAN